MNNIVRKKILIVAAEASSAHYAERLIDYWQSQKKNYEIFGIGSKNMEEKGFRRIGNSEDMSIVGIVEVVSQYQFLKGVFTKLVEEAYQNRPDLIILMDYPDFNLKFVKEISKLSAKKIYYVPPQVWAWRKKRINIIRQNFDSVISLFPFEYEFYKKENVPVKYFGHPLTDELADKFFDEKQNQDKRKRLGFLNSDFVIGLMPGSRKSELKLNFSTQLATAQVLANRFSFVKVVVLQAPGVDRELLKSYMQNIQIPVVILNDHPFEMIRMTDYIIATSGTATLFVALLNKPMLVMYKLKFLTALLAKLIVKGVRFFSLPNLVLDKEVVKEFFQEKANADNLANYVSQFIENKNLYQEQQKELSNISLKLKTNSSFVNKHIADYLESYLI